MWALGLVLYEMLAGRPGYPELATYEQFIVRLVSQPPDPLLDVAPWVPRSLATVVHEALAHDVHERIPTCNELLRRLLRLQTASGRPAPVGKAETVERSHVPPRGRRLPGAQVEDPTAVRPWPRAGALSAEAADQADDDAPQFFNRKALFSEARRRCHAPSPNRP